MALAVPEFLILIGVFVADDSGLIPVSKTPVLLAIAWLSLRLRGLRWRDAGLVRPARVWRAAAVGVAQLAGGSGGWTIALAVATAMFGWAHYAGQDLSGALQEGLSGLLLGVLFLATGRTLTVANEPTTNYSDFVLNENVWVTRETTDAGLPYTWIGSYRAPSVASIAD